MPGARWDRIRWIEMVVGLLPITILLGPLLPYGLLITAVPVLIGAAYGVNTLKLSDGSLPLFLSIIFAGVGLPALWAAFLLDPGKLVGRRAIRYAVAIALLLGLMADAYWVRLAVFPAPGLRPDRFATLFWAFLLLAPMVVAVKYLHRWLRRPRPEQLQN